MRSPRSRYPFGRVAAIGAQIVDVLSAVHWANILHRDLKPGSAMVMLDGTVRVLDLGVGLALDSDATRQYGRRRRQSPLHVPREGGQGELTALSDLYNLGCLLYELLVGTPPFTDTSDIEVLRKHMTEIPAPLELMRRDIPEALTGLVDALLRKNPADRPADAARRRDPHRGQPRGTGRTAAEAPGYRRPVGPPRTVRAEAHRSASSPSRIGSPHRVPT